jgi:hypothetical protein
MQICWDKPWSTYLYFVLYENIFLPHYWRTPAITSNVSERIFDKADQQEGDVVMLSGLLRVCYPREYPSDTDGGLGIVLLPAHTWRDAVSSQPGVFPRFSKMFPERFP